MKKFISLLITSIILSINSFPAFAENALQQNEAIINSSDSQLVYQTVTKILDQNGFEITSEDEGLGFICAKRASVQKTTDLERLGAYSVIFGKYIGTTIITYGLAAPLLLNQIPRIKKELEKKTVVIEINANITPLNQNTKIKITILEKTYDNKDISRARLFPRKISSVKNPLIYKQIFDNISSAVNI